MKSDDDARLRGWLKIARCRGLEPRRGVEIAREVGAATIGTADRRGLRRAGLSHKQAAMLGARELARTVDEELARARAEGVLLLHPDDERYPERLHHLGVPPPLLSVVGDPALLVRGGVAIVGPREPSRYGLSMAARFARELAARGIVVVSGLARGVDASAHEAALSVGGDTVAVLGTGVDVPYPRAHPELGRRIASRGALVSEFPFGAQPLPRHFPRRNRVIVGLVDVLLVVEAAQRSGSLTTARWATEENRQVMALPGRVGERLAVGTNALIRDGAGLVTSVEDLLAELPLETLEAARPPIEAGEVGSEHEKAEREASAPRLPEGLAAAAPEVLRAIHAEEDTDLDELVEALRLPSEEILAALFALELAGLIEALPGGRYARGAGRAP